MVANRITDGIAIASTRSTIETASQIDPSLMRRSPHSTYTVPDGRP